MKFGAKIILPYGATKVDCSRRPLEVQLCSNMILKARSLVVASGARYRKLNLENNEQFDNAGVYYAATAMEGEACGGEEVIFVGGGNSAGQAAVFLSQQAKHVHMLIRGDSLAASMSEYLISRIDMSPKITLHRNTEITQLIGERHLEQVELTSRQSGESEIKRSVMSS